MGCGRFHRKVQTQSYTVVCDSTKHVDQLALLWPIFHIPLSVTLTPIINKQNNNNKYLLLRIIRFKFPQSIVINRKTYVLERS